MSTVVLVVVAVGVAPFYGLALWNVRQRVSWAGEESRAGRGGSRRRVASTVGGFGLVAAIFIAFGVTSLVGDNRLVGALLLGFGLAYGAAIYAGVAGRRLR